MVERLIGLVVQLVQDTRVRFFNPTREWPACTVSRLEYDMRSHRLNGMPVEGPIAAARILGKADWFSGGDQDPDLDYRSLGLQVACHKGVITGFRAILRPESRHSARERAFRPADLTLIAPNGSTLGLSERTAEADLVAFLGTPMETGPVVGDRVHSFWVKGNLLESFHDPATGQLLEILFGRSADEKSSSSATESSQDARRRRSA